MKIKNLHYTCYFLISLGIFLALVGFNNKSPIPANIKEQNPETTSEKHIFLDYIKQEEEKIYELLKEYAITKEALETAKQDFIYTQYKDKKHYQEKDLDNSIREIIKNVCNDFCINYNELSIKLFSHASPAAANEKTLFIDQKEFLKLSQKAQYFIIAHELRHYVHQDTATGYAIKNLLTKNSTKIPFDQKDRNHPLNRRSRFTELRADIEAASKNAFYADCYKIFMQETLAVDGDTPGISHPKNSYRLALSANIGAEFNAVA